MTEAGECRRRGFTLPPFARYQPSVRAPFRELRARLDHLVDPIWLTLNPDPY